MSAISQASETKPSQAQSASEKNQLVLEIHVLHCGQGDTILLRLLRDKWALIDCCLSHGLARQQFFDLVASLGIRRLDLVCLTHPHDDHYTGMEEVLRYFNSGGRSVGIFCDCGTEPKEIQTFLARRKRPKSSVREYGRLYQYVFELISTSRIKYFRADENSVPIIASDQMQLMPVGPRPEVARLAVQGTLSSGKIRTDLNRLSVVLALIVRSSKHSFDALLSADTDVGGFRSAMERLQARLSTQSSPLFDVVKVSHHGSNDSHQGSGVCAHRKTGTEAVAAVSAGPFDVLPDREVLRDFLDHNWIVMLTSKRFKSRLQHALELAGKQPSQSTAIKTQNLMIKWSEDTGLAWSPPEARLVASELQNYQAAIP